MSEEHGNVVDKNEPIQRPSSYGNESSTNSHPVNNNHVLDMSSTDEPFVDSIESDQEHLHDFNMNDEIPPLVVDGPVDEPGLVAEPFVGDPPNNDDANILDISSIDEPSFDEFRSSSNDRGPEYDSSPAKSQDYDQEISLNPSDEISPRKVTPIHVEDTTIQDPQNEGGKSNTPTAQAVPEIQKLEPLHSSAPPATSSPTKSVVAIEHHITTTNNNNGNNNNRSASAFFLGMSKPVVFGVGAIVIGSMIVAGVFAGGFFQIPGLNKQIDDLESQVNRLEDTVVDLNDQVDELETVIGGLNKTVANLTSQVDILEEVNDNLNETNQQLNETVETLTIENQNLNDTVTSLSVENQKLNDTVIVLNEQNEELNNTVNTLTVQNQQLNASITELEYINDNLTTTNQLLEVEVIVLNNRVEDLNMANAVLEQTNEELTENIQELETEIFELEAQIDQLESILLALNDSIPINSTEWDELLKALNETVSTNRQLVLTNLELYYDGVNQAWVCQYATDFAGEPFLEAPNEPMGQPAYDNVIANVNANVLLEMCLDVTNYKLYVEFQTGKDELEVTFNEIRSTVARYTQDAINYYFKQPDEGGLTPLDWAKAGYNCQNLPPEKRYIWTLPITNIFP